MNRRNSRNLARGGLRSPSFREQSTSALSIVEENAGDGHTHCRTERRADGKLLKGLAALQGPYEMIADVRGKGLMIGIGFRAPDRCRCVRHELPLRPPGKGCLPNWVVMTLMREQRILTQVAGPDINTIKLLPPLIIGDEEVEMIVAAFDAVMTEAASVGGRVWAQSVQLVEHALESQV